MNIQHIYTHIYTYTCSIWYGYVYIGTCISVYICVDMFVCVYNVCEWMLVAMNGSPFVLNEGYLDQTPLTAGTRSPLSSHCVNMIYFTLPLFRP